MANVKISQLPAASTITPGADVVPIVHSGATQKATLNQIVKEVLKSPGDIGATTPGGAQFWDLFSSSTTILDGTTIPSNKTLVTTDSTQTLTGKTINLANNTLTGTLAEFNTACSDSNFSTTSGSETLTNKTINLANNTLTGTIAQFNTACSDADFATLAGAENLSNKTLASNCYLANVKIASGNALNDASGNEYLKFQSVASAVNEVTLTNAAAGNGPNISSTGNDADIDLRIGAKGFGAIRILNDVVISGTTYPISVAATGAVTSSVSLGYATGAGSTVTQTGSRTSSVTINKICGQITTVSATTSDNSFTSFTVNNSTVAATDTVILSLATVGFNNKYLISAVDVTAGAFKIQTYTPIGVLAAESLMINFSVIKSVTS